jgi:hypothetical protein
VGPVFDSSSTNQWGRYFFDKLGEGGKRPGVGAVGAGVFDGVEMDVISESFEFFFVSDRVFPEPPLPQASFLMGFS